MKQVIWYLHHYAGAPQLGMTYRPYYLAQEFKALGLQPYIIAAHHHHLLFQQKTQKQAIKSEDIDGIPYLWLKTPKYVGNDSKRLFNILSYSCKIALYAKRLQKITGKPDVIIVPSNHAMHYLAARRIARKCGAKLIFEVCDLWPLSLIEIHKYSRFHPFIMLLSWLEKTAYRHSDYVVTPLANAASHMIPRGLDLNKFRYIANGISLRHSENFVQENCEKIRQLRLQNKFLLGYVGAHGIPNALDQLIDAAHLLQQQECNDIHIILIGAGKEKTRLQQKAQTLRNITFLEPVVKTKIPNVLSQMDAVFIGWKNLELYKYGVSANKIFDYMLAAKPIIHAINSQYDPVQQAQCGVIVPPENPPELAKAISEFAKLPQNVLVQMGQRGKTYVCAHHDYKVLAQQYAALFK